MTRLVVDSCVVIKWLIDEPSSADARNLSENYFDGTLQLLAPDLIYAEVSSVLWKKAGRRLISTDGAWQALRVFRRYRFAITACADLLDEATQIAFDYDQSPYDCFYVALSRREGCSLVTSDEKLLRKLSRAFPHVILLGGHS